MSSNQASKNSNLAGFIARLFGFGRKSVQQNHTSEAWVSYLPETSATKAVAPTEAKAANEPITATAQPKATVVPVAEPAAPRVIVLGDADRFRLPGRLATVAQINAGKSPSARGAERWTEATRNRPSLATPAKKKQPLSYSPVVLKPQRPTARIIDLQPYIVERDTGRLKRAA